MTRSQLLNLIWLRIQGIQTPKEFEVSKAYFMLSESCKRAARAGKCEHTPLFTTTFMEYNYAEAEVLVLKSKSVA